VARATGCRDAPPLSLRVAQLPFDAGNRWLGLDASERPSEYDTARDRGALSIVAAFGAPLGAPILAADAGSEPARLTGLLLDQWDELVPSAGAKTGVSFQYDGPAHRLRNVCSSPSPPAW